MAVEECGSLLKAGTTVSTLVWLLPAQAVTGEYISVATIADLQCPCGVVRACRQGKDMLYIDLFPWFVLIRSVNNHFQCTQISLQLLQSPSIDHTWPASGHCKHSTWSWWVSIWNMHVIHIVCVCVWVAYFIWNCNLSCVLSYLLFFFNMQRDL